MEPGLWELLKGDDDDEVEVILRLTRPDVIPPGVRVITQFGHIITARLRRGAILDTRTDESVASMKAAHPVTPDDDLDEESAFAPTQDSDNRRPRVESATGQGVIVGVVDWGCDFTHPNFRHADGTTRLLALWDQSAPYQPQRANRYGYGTIYTAEEINRALDANDPIAALGYEFYKSDPGGGTHGTHVMDIAAGNGRAGGPMGVAPEADLAFVHLHNRGLPSQTTLGSSVAVVEAADFILNVAPDRPTCLNFSMGRQTGPHDGSTLVEQAFDAVLTVPGRIIVQSAGNYYDRMAHSSGRLRPGEVRVIPFTISEADVTPNELEIWYPGRDVFAVQVRTPAGIISKKTGLDDQASIRVGNQVVGQLYHRSREPNNRDNHCRVYIEHGGTAGTWAIILTGVDVVDGRFHLWIERDATCPGCQARFDNQYAIPQMTTGTICNGLRTIAVGAYNAHDPERRLGRFSSAGPTRDGRTKPNLVAPGVQVLAARSRPRFDAGLTTYWTRKSGTSMAAPYVTGALALMFETAGAYKLASNETLNLLLSSAAPADIEGDEIYRMGSGYLDVDAAIASTRQYVRARQPVGQKGVVEAEMVNHAYEIVENRESVVESGAEWNETTEAGWLELAESDLEGEALLPVHVHLQRVLQRVGAPMDGSPRDLYHIFAGSGASPLRQLFDVVVMPGATPTDRLRSGDLLLRRVPGHGYVHLAFIASNDVLPAQQAVGQGWILETLRPGYYTIVVEAGANPHRAAQHFARWVLDRHGVAPPNQVVLRPRHAAESEQIEATVVEAEVAKYDEGDLHEDLLEAEFELAEDNPPPMTPAHRPAAVPDGSPVPFAPVLTGASFWPIITNHRLGRTVSFLSDTGVTVGWEGRRFMANRSGGGRNHAGIDLFANFDDPVVAIADGEIVNFFPFCCGQNQTTSALLVAHANVVVNYGEIAPDSLRRNGLRIGSRVAAGQTIAFVGRNPGGSSMIHFETYVPGSRRNARWLVGQPHPGSLLNPTQLLLHLQQHGQAGVRGGGTPTTPGQPTPTPTPSAAINRRSPDYTRWVQSSLNRVMNAGLLVDGVRGPRTRAAIRAFQQSKGLTVDGIVGSQTEAALMAAGAPPPLTLTPVTAPREPAIESEAQPVTAFAETTERRTPDYIRWVQSSLNRLMNAGLTVDGISGRQTRTAVGAFQQSRGLLASGVVDPQTEAALIAAGAPPPGAPRPPTTPARVGRAEIREAPLLRRHRGTRPDLILRWNAGQTAPSQVDVVVHLHGFSERRERMSLSGDKEGMSGLDFANPDDPTDSSPGRQQPTLGILPRGNYFGGKTGRGYNFPALTTPTGLRALIDFSLAHFARQVGAEQVQMGRLILTAHSGGGAALMRILEHNDPDEVHVFDALYGEASRLIQWANQRIQRDQAALPAASDPQRYAREQAGALRVFYVANTRPEVNSLVVQRALATANLPPDLSQRYRVEATSVSHNNIPRRFGWRLLANAGSNLAQTRGAPADDAPPREAVAESMGQPAMSFAETIGRRSREYVRWVQASLNQVMNAGLTVDGVNSPLTHAAVRAFQQSRGLTADGIIGPQTEAELMAAGALLPAGATVIMPVSENALEDFETLAENHPQPPVLQTITHAGPYRLAYDRLTTLGVIEALPGRHTRRFRGTAALQAILNTWAPYIQQVMQPPAYILTGGLTVNKPGEHGRGNAIDIDGFWWSDTNSFLAVNAPSDWYRYLTIEATLRKVFGTVLNYDYNAAHHDHWHCDLGRPTTWRAARSQVNFVQRALREIWSENLAVNGQWTARTQAAARRNGYDLSVAGEWDHFLDDIIRRQSTPPRSSQAAQPGDGQQETVVTDFVSGLEAEQAQGENWCRIRRRISTVGLVENAHWTAPNGNKRRENEAAMRPRLEAYWRAVPGVDAAVMAQRSAIDAEEWSAAFICFVMQTAGVRAAHGFVFGQRHMLYIVGALRNRERSDRDRPFWLYDLIESQREATPQIGDLLCANRANEQGVMSNHSYASLRREWWVNNPQAEPTGRSHCNLVVDIITRGNRRFLQVVGGNRAIPGAGDRGLTVRVSEVEIDQQGTIVNPAAQNLFGIVKLIECSDFQ